MSPNKPAAPNPAIASQLQIESHWRGIGEPGRSAHWAFCPLGVLGVLTVDRVLAVDHACVVKVRDVLERLHREGWTLARQRGSHRQFVHSDGPGRRVTRVTVAGHPHLDIPKGTLNSIFKQAGWK